MTFTMVQVAIFLLLYLLCRYITKRLGIGHQPRSKPARPNDHTDIDFAFRRVERPRREEFARAWADQEAEIGPGAGAKEAETRRIEAEMTRRPGRQ